MAESEHQRLVDSADDAAESPGPHGKDKVCDRGKPGPGAVHGEMRVKSCRSVVTFRSMSPIQYGFIAACVGVVFISFSLLAASHHRSLIGQQHAESGDGVHGCGLFRQLILWVHGDEPPDGVQASRGTTRWSSALKPPTSATGPKCDVSSPDSRFDCYPGPGSSKNTCESRGCCWQANTQHPIYDTNRTTKTNTTLDSPPIDVPFCYFPTDYEGYVVVSKTVTDNGLTAVLKRQTQSGWPGDIMELVFDVYMETNERIHFKLTDPQTKRYEVPIATPDTKTTAQRPLYQFELQDKPIGIVIKRASTGTVIFDSTVAPLIYADQFLQMSTSVLSGLVYGLGEHRAPLLYNISSWKQVSFWSRDLAPAVDSNLYGDHRFYMSVEKDGNAYGVFLLNSNAMEMDLQPYPALTFRTIGGIFDFYVYLGPTPDQVVEQHAAVIGKPHLPVYWALGFNLCRWGYNNISGIKEVIHRMRAAQFPYDVQWMDIDYMKDYLDWTYDETRFPGLPAVVQDLHDHKQHFVMIVDPGISSSHRGSYPPYDQGIKQGVFINNATDQPIIGRVWPGETVYPDFTNPKTVSWWFQTAKSFHDKVPFDGLWTDMNEPSNFVDGSVDGCPDDKLNNPPYTPSIEGNALKSKTLCASAKQYIGSHYNIHSLYGHSEVVATRLALEKIRGPKRSLIISRSSFPGTGQYGGHWTGDNKATWENLYYSIPAILNFQMFGIPLVGADVCGFSLDTTEELCTRWMQLGAFYPFMRNHNVQHAKAQDPASFSLSAQQSMRAVLRLRYSLLPYLYTLFYESHTQGGAVAKPLFFKYPHDRTTANIDRQFMWGSGLLISPVLDQGHTSVKAYFPKDVWYDYSSGQRVQPAGQWMTLPAPLDHINVHIRGGNIIPSQNPANTTFETRKRQFNLIVALNEKEHASGLLYWDDGEEINATEKGLYTLLKFNAEPGSLSSVIETQGYIPDSGMALDKIRILGLSKGPSHVQVNGETVGFTWFMKTQVLEISAKGVTLLKSLSVKWS